MSEEWENSIRSTEAQLSSLSEFAIHIYKWEYIHIWRNLWKRQFSIFILFFIFSFEHFQSRKSFLNLYLIFIFLFPCSSCLIASLSLILIPIFLPPHRQSPFILFQFIHSFLYIYLLLSIFLLSFTFFPFSSCSFSSYYLYSLNCEYFPFHFPLTESKRQCDNNKFFRKVNP